MHLCANPRLLACIQRKFEARQPNALQGAALGSLMQALGWWAIPLDCPPILRHIQAFKSLLSLQDRWLRHLSGLLGLDPARPVPTAVTTCGSMGGASLGTTASMPTAKKSLTSMPSGLGRKRWVLGNCSLGNKGGEVTVCLGMSLYDFVCLVKGWV